MKRLIMLLTVGLFIMSCNKEENEIKETADLFLKSFLTITPDSASKYCTPEFISSEIDSLKIPIDKLDSGAKEMLKKQLVEVVSEVLTVEKRHGKDSVRVNFSISRPGSEPDKENTLILVKQGEVWKVAGIML